ncbi:universal stress protein [Aureibaculum luteum]|uniref:universal stress protein n=1 Tax=Aureibaculum luteum TaxID=1548456 RepID=UPI001300B92D|nr:universal stress protein [Aureibaculum luteum]
MKRILLLTDFSNNASNAIAYAMQFFSGDTIEFYVLNVQKVSKYITSDLIASPKKSIYDSVIKNPKKTLEILVNDLKKEYANEAYTFEGVCDYDSFVSAIKQLVEIEHVDMIVMGTNGASSIKETVFGSNTIQVIEKVDLPILVIPNNYKYCKPSQVLFINDTEISMNKNIVKSLVGIISKFHSDLNILTIVNQNEQDKYNLQKEALNSFFKDTALNFYSDQNMSIENAVEHFTATKEIQLIAKIIHVESFFKRIFSKASATEITYASKIPILFL